MTDDTISKTQVFVSIAELEKRADGEDAQFTAWRNAIPDKHWVRLDLHALRVGYELGKTNAKADDVRGEVTDAIRLGNDRYERLRCVTPQEFRALWMQCIEHDARFDDLVDQLGTKAAIPPRSAR